MYVRTRRLVQPFFILEANPVAVCECALPEVTAIAVADIQSLPEQVIQEAAQLTKQNSISGVKAPEVSIVYTLASNLKKSGDMDIGQVGFKNQKQVLFLRHVKKDKEMIKRLEKSRQEPAVDLKLARHLRDRKEFQLRKEQQQQNLQQQQERERQRQEEEELRSYAALRTAKAEEMYKGDGSIECCRNIEEDFL